MPDVVELRPYRGVHHSVRRIQDQGPCPFCGIEDRCTCFACRDKCLSTPIALRDGPHQRGATDA